MIRITAFALALFLAASCSLPLGISPSSPSMPSNRLPGTASLTVSTPYGTSRAVAAVRPVQGTVEPENLGQLFDHVTVVLDSLAQPNVTKTVPAGQASLIRLDGLYEASDWTLNVTAYDASNAPVATFQWNQGGISTFKGQVTNIGDIFVNPVPGPGTAAFQVNLIDLPAALDTSSMTWSLEPLNADGSLGTPLTAGDLAKVAAVWSGRQLTLGTASGQELPTGSYRLTYHLQDLAGQALALSPIFVVNLYPALTSTKTFSATAWSGLLSAPNITFPQNPTTSNAGIVISWQPDDPMPVVGYEYFFIPDTSALPDLNSITPEFFSRPGTRSGFIAASAISRFRPSWVLPAADIPAAQVLASDWGFYVRAVTVSGDKGTWSSTVVAVDVSFNVVLNSITVLGATAGRYELRRIGPSTQYPLEVAPDGLINPEIDSYPTLGRFAFDVGDPSSAPQTLPLPEPWILAPGQQLVLESPDGMEPVQVWFDRTTPNHTPFDLSLYGNETQKYSSLIDDTVTEHAFIALGSSLPTMAGPGNEWSFRMPSSAVVETLITSSAVAPVTDPLFDSPGWSYQLVPLNYQGFSSSYLPDFTKAKTVLTDTWTAMNWPGGIEATTSRSVVARPVWNLGAGVLVYGAWSPLGMSPGTSVAPANVTVNVNTNMLTWDAVDDSGWGAAHVTGYMVDKVGGGVPGLPITLDPGVLQLDVSSYGVGEYSVTTAFQRPDGRSGTSAAAQWPMLISLPGSVMADDANRLPDNVAHKPANARGRYTDLAADLYTPGWLASGYSGAAAALFLSRHDGNGRLDTNYGLYSGTVFPGGGNYFGDSMGFVQEATVPYAVVMNSVVQNGVGNNEFRQFSFQGVPEPGYNDNAGSRFFAGVPFGIDQVPLGRLVMEPSSGQVFSLMWDGGPDGGGAASNYGVTRVEFDGTIPALNWLNTEYLHRLAVKDSTTLLAIGNGGLIKRLSTSGLNLLVATDSTIWTSDGVATVTVDGVTPDWKDILVMGDGRILLTGWSGTDGYVVRLQSLGNLDTSFNGTGWVKLPGFFPQDLAVNASSVVAVTGDLTAAETDTSLAFLKVFSATGTPNPWLDKTLAGTSVHGASARAVAYNAAGRLMVAGFTRNSSNLQDTIPALWRF